MQTSNGVDRTAINVLSLEILNLPLFKESSKNARFSAEEPLNDTKKYLFVTPILSTVISTNDMVYSSGNEDQYNISLKNSCHC